MTVEAYLRSRLFYRHWFEVALRYNDTDRQGHVNNVAFATFCEQGRADFLLGQEAPRLPEGATFVLARLTLDYVHEVFWPGSISVGTEVLRVGRSSMTLAQGMFIGEDCVATAINVIVLVDAERRPTPWPDTVRNAVLKAGSGSSQGRA